MSGDTAAYVCQGSGTNYAVRVTTASGVQTVFTGSTPSGTLTLSNNGDYEASCTIDGDSGVACGSGPLDCAQVYGLSQAIQADLISRGGYFDDISRA